MQGETTCAIRSDCLERSPPSVFDELPPEVAGLIFELLQPKDIKSARLVSRCVVSV